MIDVAIIGAGGFTGKELLTLLATHPSIRPVHITSNQHAGKPIGEIFPSLDGKLNLTFQQHEAPLPERIPVFLAVPNDTSLALVPKLFEQGHPVVDLSGAYRLHNRGEFETHYGLTHTSFQLMEHTVYGLPELFREKVRTARLVANPGCFPTGAILPIALLGETRDRIASISVDAKSGVSGAGGRTEDAGFSFNSVYENFRAYKVLKHQHAPEIVEYATGDDRSPLPIVFIPHLLPLFRGILSTIVIRWNGEAPTDLKERFRDIAESEPFIRFRNEPEEIHLSSVQHTNFIDISLRTESDVTVIVSAIDNLIKGAAGQAIQNMNLMLGLEETAGLIEISRN